MDECLPLGLLDASTLQMLLTQERLQRQEMERMAWQWSVHPAHPAAARSTNRVAPRLTARATKQEPDLATLAESGSCCFWQDRQIHRALPVSPRLAASTEVIRHVIESSTVATFSLPILL